MGQGPITRRFVSLCVPFLYAMAVDGCVTLVGQPAEYWAGNYDRVNEWSLTFNDLLHIHPVALVVGLLFNGALICILILLLPRLLAMIASFAATFGHTWGAMTWLIYVFRFNYAECQLFVCSVAVVMAICLSKGWAPDTDRPLMADKPAARWALMTFLAVIPIYLFLLRPSS